MPPFFPQVASSDFKIHHDGTLLQAGSPAAGDEDLVPISTIDSSSSARLSSALPNSYFKELRSVEFQQPSGSVMFLNVHAVARIIKLKSALGSVVKLVTQVGTIILDGDVVSFSNDAAPIMEEAGFVVHHQTTSSGRR